TSPSLRTATIGSIRRSPHRGAWGNGFLHCKKINLLPTERQRSTFGELTADCVSFPWSFQKSFRLDTCFWSGLLLSCRVGQVANGIAGYITISLFRYTIIYPPFRSLQEHRGWPRPSNRPFGRCVEVRGCPPFPNSAWWNRPRRA